jgi:cyclopropane-fatty-acyl-phospholipid synthase
MQNNTLDNFGTIELTRDNLKQKIKGLPSQAKIMLKALTFIKFGSLTITLPNRSTFLIRGKNKGPSADLTLYNWKLIKRALSNGTIGIAESYIDEDWNSKDISIFLEFFCINENVGYDLTTGNWLLNTLAKLRHFLNSNTKAGSKRNISAHYDLGNAFYKEWLDPSMTYSSALYSDGANDLESAQMAKYRSLAQLTDIQSHHHVLEVGCGWGGFAEYAATHIGCKVTCLTISEEQYKYAVKRINDKGLSDKVKIKKQDYRDESSTYDRIASIEMFEAVGEKFWPTYFNKLHDCLKPNGKAGLQIITIKDRAFEIYRHKPDFIQRYIFPGGMLPSPEALEKVTKPAGFKLIEDFGFGKDYARTLAEWRVKFWQAWPKLKPLGFDERFKRLWEFYFHYCEAGFNAGHIDVRQMVYSKNQ